MNLARPGLAALLLATLGLGASAGRVADDPKTIDRWLVSDPIVPPDSGIGGPALQIDMLSTPGEPGVLPRRGERSAGVTWHLVRHDVDAAFSLQELVPDGAAPGSVVYAHAYVRLPEDRTLRLAWRDANCGSRAWLNGRPLEAPEIRARFGGGWNTILVKLVAGECPGGLRVTLAPVDDGGLGSVRVRASRPFGDVRTGPSDWVVADDTVRVDERRRWRGDRLYAGLAVGLTAWGRAPVPDVGLELRGGPDGRARAPWLTPGETAEAIIPVRLDRLADVLRDGEIDVRLRWRDVERDRRLAVTGTAPVPGSPVALDGWEVASVAGGSPRETDVGQLPNGSNWVLNGEWKVPEALAGQSLTLDAARSPADYRLNGTPAGRGDVRLCSPCAKGTTLRITATSTAQWTGVPLVRVAGGP